MAMDAMDHDGHYPSNLTALAQNYASQPKLYLCPGSGTPPGAMTNVDQWMDDIYLYWPHGEKTPTNYPWIYERRLSHHQGRGIHVAPVGGDAFWDEGATGLQRFAKEHPELRIPMPEDLRTNREANQASPYATSRPAPSAASSARED
jgi:hypothetical protein